MINMEHWKEDFFKTVVADKYVNNLKKASLNGDLKQWTKLLTNVVVNVCNRTGWAVAAKGHRLDVVPEPREEYFGIDVMAFEKLELPWLFPIAAIELENSQKDDRICYSLWKTLNVDAQIRIVFCYRAEMDEGTHLVKYLADQVLSSMSIERRSKLSGETFIVVGYRNRAETFPYSFFKWWIMNGNTAQFEQY